jgi:hypothetical protein
LEWGNRVLSSITVLRAKVLTVCCVFIVNLLENFSSQRPWVKLVNV